MSPDYACQLTCYMPKLRCLDVQGESYYPVQSLCIFVRKCYVLLSIEEVIQ